MGKHVAPWKKTFPPFRLFGNVYFVGTLLISAHVIDTGDGLILMDTGYSQDLYLVLDNMYRLGLDPHKIKYVLLTHGHIDHVGGALALRELTGAKLCIGEKDRRYVNGEAPLSFAEELDMEFTEIFEPDLLFRDGDTLALGDTVIRCVATPGHTEGAMSYFFETVQDGARYVAALHGGAGLNSLRRDFLTARGLPFSLREDYVRSMHRLNEEKVDIFLGNHMRQSHTDEKYLRLCAGDPMAFVDPEGWRKFNLKCIRRLEKMLKEENDELQHS